jgi:hypothetical protein
MILWWVFLGVCVAIFGVYDACFVAPGRRQVQQQQAQWERQHFNGWRLEQITYEAEHGLYNDRLEHQTCTTKAYPGYSACPPQQYYVEGNPQPAILNSPSTTTPAVHPEKSSPKATR